MPFDLGANELEFLTAILLALVCGVIIGVERELKHKPAGLRTQTLVIGAATLFAFLSHTVIGADPTRIAAQIVTGVGFLGAGMILRSSTNHVDNVTTAASIWFAASVGMALGFGYYTIGLVATLFAVLIPILLRVPKKYLRAGDDQGPT